MNKEQEYKEFLKETHKQLVDKNYYWFATDENYNKLLTIKKFMEQNNMMSRGFRNFFKQAHLCKKKGKLDEYTAIINSLL